MLAVTRFAGGRPTQQAMIPAAAGTAFGPMSLNGGLAAAFNGTTAAITTACATRGGASDAWIGKDFGAGAKRQLTGFRIYGSSDSGILNGGGNITITAYGSDSAPATGTDGTALGSAGPVADSNSIVIENLTSVRGQPFRYIWLYIAQTGGSQNIYVAEVEFFEDV
jgi:hypothetical protein